jgi:hypothetical protein
MGCAHDNLFLLRQARQRIESAGGHLATAAQVRERMRQP